MRFSFGIPAFKSAFIKECIDSILTQTYPEFELIIINDASPDPIDEIIRSYSDGRIQYLKNEKNIGAEKVVLNWNKCLAQAKGDYFILMGDDDKLEPNYLEEFDKLIKKYPELDIFHCRSYIINSNSEIIALTPSWPEYENIYDNIWHRVKGYRSQYISDFVYNTEILKNKGGFYYLPLAWGSDDISAYIQMNSKGVAHTNRCLLNYRNSPITISNSGNVDLKLLAIEGEKQWFDNFIGNTAIEEINLLKLNQIKNLLPSYFQNKKKYTLALFYNKNFLKGIALSFKEIWRKQLTPKESLLAFFKAFKHRFQLLFKF